MAVPPALAYRCAKAQHVARTRGGQQLKEEEEMAGITTGRRLTSRRQAYTFHLDPRLVDRARAEIGEGDVVRSIEAALAAALDYQMWVREVSAGERDVLS